MQELQNTAYQTEELSAFRSETAAEVHAAIAALNRERFEVRAQLAAVDKYAAPAALDALDTAASEEIITRLAPLIPAARDEESARRLDVIVYRMMLAHAAHEMPIYERAAQRVQQIAARLAAKTAIPEVAAQTAMLAELRTSAFWQHADLPQLDRIRCDLRGLMQYLRAEIRTKEINISDEVISAEVGTRLTKSTALEGYYARANRYVQENAHHPLLTKLRNNIPLSKGEWEKLEQIFWEEVGSEREYVDMLRQKKAVDASRPPQDTLGTFIRSLTGLSEEAARTAFSEFLDTTLYNEEQIALIRQIMEWVMQNGTMDVAELGKPVNFGGAKFWEVFQGLTYTEKIRGILERIKKNAAWTAA